MLARSIGTALAFSLSFTPPATPQTRSMSVKAVNAIGEAPILKRNQAVARSQAIQNAMVQAFGALAQEMLSPVFVQTNQDVLWEKVEKSPRRYVRDYKLLGQSVEEEMFYVETEMMMRVGMVREDLVRWGMIYDGVRRPKFGIFPLMEKKTLNSTRGNPSLVWTARLANRLRGMGYEVEEIRTKAVDASSVYDIGISGSFSTYGDKNFSASLHLARRKPSQNLARLNVSFPLSKEKELVVGLLALNALQRVLPAWFRQTGEGRQYALIVRGLKSFADYEKLLDSLHSSQEGFLSAKEKIYSPGEVTFQVLYNGSLNKFVGSLNRIRLAKLRFNITEAQGNTVYIEVQ